MRIPSLGLGLHHIATMRSIARGLAPLFREIEAAGPSRTGMTAMRAIEHAIHTPFEHRDGELWAEFVVLHIKARIVISGVPVVRVALTMEKCDVQVVVSEPATPTGWGIV
jgi:hypothetical protein